MTVLSTPAKKFQGGLIEIEQGAKQTHRLVPKMFAFPNHRQYFLKNATCECYKSTQTVTAKLIRKYRLTHKAFTKAALSKSLVKLSGIGLQIYNITWGLIVRHHNWFVENLRVCLINAGVRGRC